MARRRHLRDDSDGREGWLNMFVRAGWDVSDAVERGRASWSMYPDIFKGEALIAIEPAGVGDLEKAPALKNIPALIVYGDYIEQDAR